VALLNEYEIGDIAVASATFNRNTGTQANPIWTPTDATDVECEVRKPSGLVSNYVVAAGQIVHDSTGNYHLDVLVNEEGDWWFEFEGTGTAGGTKTGGWRVVEQRVDESILNEDALVSLGLARSYVLGSPSEASKDEQIAFLINWTSRAFRNYVKREFVPHDAVTRTFEYQGGGYLSLSPFELRSVDTVSLYTDTDDVIELTTDDYRLEPRGGTLEGTYLILDLITADPLETSNNFRWQVEIEGDWGMSEIPADVKGAALIMIKDLWMNPGAFRSYNVGPVQLAEGELAGLAPVGSVPPGARRALRPYLRSKQTPTISISRPLQSIFRGRW
jgi:hypothetical protein